MTLFNSIEPAVGQMWADNDTRSKGAGEFTIIELVTTTAGPKVRVKRESGRKTLIKASRFKDGSKHGYRYLGRSR